MSGTAIVPGQTQTSIPIVFDYVWFQVNYPEIASACSYGMANNYFNLATMFCNNNGNGVSSALLPTGEGFYTCYSIASPVTNPATLQGLLGMMTAHIATLFAPINGNPPSTLVGRISSAGEGSVNVATDFPSQPGSEWFNQTKYGAMFWAATKIYRMARYYPGPQPFMRRGPWGGDAWGGGGAGNL